MYLSNKRHHISLAEHLAQMPGHYLLFEHKYLTVERSPSWLLALRIVSVAPV